MLSKSVAVFFSNDVPTTNADGVLPFVQNSDLFYLSGIDQEDTILLLHPDAALDKNKAVLFIRPTDEHLRIWEGPKLSPEEAAAISGIAQVKYVNEFESYFRNICLSVDNIYLNTNEHARAEAGFSGPSEKFIIKCRELYPLHTYRRAAPLLAGLRTIKHEEEIKLIKKAADITGKAFDRVLSLLKPGVYEFEVEAAILHEFMLGRSRRPAFDTIVASGANACILHYVHNNSICREGDMVLIDFGAEYANYKADVTRCLPVSGTFSPRQAQVYNAVLSILKQATELLQPGRHFADYMREVIKITEIELVNLGLITSEEQGNAEKPAYRKFFMHGISHFLGLDVHDVGDRETIFEPGMVFTCEPGIYIENEGIGVRLENDILITDNGPVNLTSHIPIEISEIESLMKAHGS